MIFERRFDEIFQEEAAGKVQRRPPQSAAPLVGGKTSKDAWGGMSDKFKDRSKELISKYKITRGSKYSLAVKFRVNLGEEVEEIPVEEPEEVVDPKKKR